MRGFTLERNHITALHEGRVLINYLFYAVIQKQSQLVDHLEIHVMCKVKLIEGVDRGISFIVDLLYYITSNLLLIMVSSVEHEHDPLAF